MFHYLTVIAKIPCFERRYFVGKLVVTYGLRALLYTLRTNIYNISWSYRFIFPLLLFIWTSIHIHMTSIALLKFLPIADFYSRFEAFNSVIRSLNFNSNQHASSLDICTKIAKMEKLRFVLSGGKWGDNRYLICTSYQTTC